MLRRTLTVGLAVGALALTAVPVVQQAASASSASSKYELLRARTGSGSQPLRWNPCQPAVTYKVNVARARENHVGKKAARRRARSEIVHAMAKVSDATGVTFQYNGKTRAFPDGSGWYNHQSAGAEIVLAYVSRGDSSLLNPGSWATGGQEYRSWDAGVAVGRGYVVMDAAKLRTMKSGFGPGNHRGNIVLHEMGHVMGLAHVNDPSQLMNPLITSRSPNGYASGDLAGLRKLGRAAGCIGMASQTWSGS